MEDDIMEYKFTLSETISRINMMKSEIAELLNSYIIVNNLNNGISFHKEYYIVSRLSGLHQWTKNNGDVFCPILKEFIVNEKSFALFFTHDAHKPGVKFNTKSNVKKIVFKILQG